MGFMAAFLPIHRDDTIFIPLRDCFGRTDGHANRISTVIAGGTEVGREKVGPIAFLDRSDTPPACRPGGKIIPILTGNHAGATTSTSRLIKKESYLHGSPTLHSFHLNQTGICNIAATGKASLVKTFGPPPLSAPFSSGSYQAPLGWQQPPS